MPEACRQAPSNRPALFIAEDDKIYAALLSRLLTGRGFRTEKAYSVKESKARLESSCPDFALLDLNLAGENGAQLIPFLIEANPKVRIVIITSYADLRATAAAVRLGADDVIAKPLTIDEIEYALKRPYGMHGPLPSDFILPEPARDVHIVEFYEKNDRNVTRTAQLLSMHRRTLQRLLRKSRTLTPDKQSGERSSGFGRARRLARFWSSFLSTS